MTLRRTVDHVSSRLDAAGLHYGHGTDSALNEAVFLVFGGLQIDYHCPESRLDEPLDDAQLSRVESLLTRRIEERVPLAYLLGHCWFAGHRFVIDERALVPRSPIAELIRDRYQPWVRPEATHRVLDLCTGSGCIGIATALAYPEARVDLADLSPDALALARENVRLHGLEDRVQLAQSDLFGDLTRVRYDLIVSNPPYVSHQEWQHLPLEYHREPSMGLLSEDNGLDIPLQIIDSAAQWLTEHGSLILEVGYSADALEQALVDEALMWIEFEQGGDGVCVLTRDQLKRISRNRKSDVQ